MGPLKRFKQWQKALRKRFENNKEEKKRFAMLDELISSMPAGLREIVDGDAGLIGKLVLALFDQLGKKDLLDELFNEKLEHLEVVEMLVRVVFFSSVRLKLATPLPFRDDDILQEFPGSLTRTSKKKCIVDTNIISAVHGSLSWKKVKVHHEMSVSSVICKIETKLVKLWNNNDPTTRKLHALQSLLNELIITNNHVQNYCSDFGYSLKQELHLLPKNGQNELLLIVPSQTAVFRGQRFIGPIRDGPFLRFELESTMLQLTVVSANEAEESYRWSMCVYRMSEEGLGSQTSAAVLTELPKLDRGIIGKLCLRLRMNSICLNERKK